MKASLQNKKEETEIRRGRVPMKIDFPKRKKGFFVDEVVELNQKKGREVSSLTIRNRLNEMTQRDEAVAVSVPSGRGHPKYLYTLVP
jgi:hypothetical protein